MIIFKNIDSKNFDKVIDLEVNKDQIGFMEDNLLSIAETTIYDHYRAKAIYLEKELIGFMLYYFVEDSPDYVYLHRFMIDRRYQGKGYGKKAVQKALKLFKQEYPCIECVELMHYPDNSIGEQLYESLGFEKTGELRDSEPCRVEKETQDPNRYVEIVRRYYY